MKLLLFDQNFSPRLVERLADIYPDQFMSLHLGLAMQWIWKSGSMPAIMII